MIPRYRAWIKTENCFADYIESIRFYINEIDLCWGGICESDCFDFKDVILMQSTGLKDKNGKEIFEGDVVRQVRTQPTTENETITGVVTMIEGTWLIMNDCEQLASKLWSETDENEIIGNIYENPELLEVNHDTIR
nr:MAG TPA: YopX protein [Caudoviricetes sp.]